MVLKIIGILVSISKIFKRKKLNKSKMFAKLLNKRRVTPLIKTLDQETQIKDVSGDITFNTAEDII